ncbi:unnamed protein product [Brassica napus]|uniref:(rape) hypothetical protein n=1 Tax=Brassica napus TaxID=3708 RepID=A0A816JTV5_BRANA|nr:unnamed protein product [Brassica napus]
MMVIDMLLINVKATLVQTSINVHNLNTFRHLLRESSLYDLKKSFGKTIFFLQK